MRTLVASTCAALLLSAAPIVATAVTVSSGDGQGAVNVTRWYGAGAQTGGALMSKSGDPVYFNGLRAYDNQPDVPWGRYTTDTTSTTVYASRGGMIGYDFDAPTRVDGVKSKICRNRNNLPDPCGSYGNMPRP